MSVPWSCGTGIAASLGDFRSTPSLASEDHDSSQASSYTTGAERNSTPVRADPELKLGSGRAYFSLMAAFTFAARSGGMVVILWAVLACSAPLAITSASSFPSMTALQPGIKSPHLSTLAMIGLLLVLLRC